MSPAKPSKKPSSMSVADYLAAQIAICGKSQMEIAEEVGFPRANVITMIKQGKTKLPIERVPKMASAIGVDPSHLLRVTLSEYNPTLLSTIESIQGRTVSDNESEILNVIRKTTKNADPKLSSPSAKAALKAFCTELTK